MSKVYSFIFNLLSLLSVVFIIHISILKLLDYKPFSNQIIATYLVNYFLALAIYLFINKLKIKYGHLTGFLFMIGSFLKFLIFFIFFFPLYRLDGVINRFEFASFFIPYLTCLVFETLFLVKILNKESIDTKNIRKRFFVLNVKSYICTNF